MPNQLPLGARVLFRIHLVCYRTTRGIVGHRISGLRFLLLTTTGIRSSKLRTTPLVYGRDGNDMILVASNGGLAKNPSWYVNLVANPTVDVQVGRNHATLRARPATAEERPRLWELMVSAYGGYERYQRKTQREIPLIILEPFG